MRSLVLAVAAVALAGLSSSAVIVDACGQERQTTSFREDVFPIFKGRCIDCHRPGGQGYEASGLDLTTYEGVMKGTKHGPMVIPGDPDLSNLMWLPIGAQARSSGCRMAAKNCPPATATKSGAGSWRAQRTIERGVIQSRRPKGNAGVCVPLVARFRVANPGAFRLLRRAIP